MKTTTLFVIGLVAGAIIVFGIRAASLDNAGAQSPTADQPRQTPPEQPASDSTGAQPSVIEVVLDADGKVVSATMEMADGTSHAVAPGAHAPMGDYTARVKGREGSYEVHLHAHSEHELELTLMSDEGDLVAQHTFTHGASGASADAVSEPPAPGTAEKLPENRICPVMGNPVDPKVYVDYEGRRIGFCCAGCDDVFKKDPEKYLKKVDAELAARKGGK